MTHRIKRLRLPPLREGITHKDIACGFEFYLTMNFYPNKADPGEVFVIIAKEGSDIAGLMDVICTLLSILLQYGIPWDKLQEKLLGHRFGNFEADIKFTSLADAIAKIGNSIIKIRRNQLK